MPYAPDHYALTWHQFEKLVIKSVIAALDPDLWRVRPQHGRVYNNYGNKKMDLHIAERRQGGRGYVIDAKHFKDSALTRNEVNTTLDYKKACRASQAIIIASNASWIPVNVEDYASQNGVILMAANRNLRSNVAKMFERFMGNYELFELAVEMKATGELELSDEISDSDLECYDLTDREEQEKIEELTA